MSDEKNNRGLVTSLLRLIERNENAVRIASLGSAAILLLVFLASVFKLYNHDYARLAIAIGCSIFLAVTMLLIYRLATSGESQAIRLASYGILLWFVVVLFGGTAIAFLAAWKEYLPEPLQAFAAGQPELKPSDRVRVFRNLDTESGRDSYQKYADAGDASINSSMIDSAQPINATDSGPLDQERDSPTPGVEQPNGEKRLSESKRGKRVPWWLRKCRNKARQELIKLEGISGNDLVASCLLPSVHRKLEDSLERAEELIASAKSCTDVRATSESLAESTEPIFNQITPPNCYGHCAAELKKILSQRNMCYREGRQCAGGRWTCLNRKLTCQPPREDDSTCNGRDDDCDGAVDEDTRPREKQCGRDRCSAVKLECKDGKYETCDEMFATAPKYPTGTYYYGDQDEDGFGDPTQKMLRCPDEPKPAKYVRNDKDCAPDDSRAYTGQTKYFSVPVRGNAKPWDFDCDDVTTKMWPNDYECELDVDGFAQVVVEGWEGGVPACGKSGNWVTACGSSDGEPTAATTEARNQKCK